MSDHTPTVAAFRRVYGEMCAVWCRDDALAEFDRFIARIKAEAVAEALLSEESVERAARALHDRFGSDPEATWQDWADEARTALTAAIGGDDE